MNTHTNVTENQAEVIGHIGWKYYNTIKKKAMEQEFSLAGLFLSLSIAFFIVLVSALFLSLFYNSIQSTNISNKVYNNNFYRLEASSQNTIHNYINVRYLEEDRLVLKRMSGIS